MSQAQCQQLAPALTDEHCETLTNAGINWAQLFSLLSQAGKYAPQIIALVLKLAAGGVTWAAIAPEIIALLAALFNAPPPPVPVPV